MELFKQQINSFMVHIPYRGIAPAITDLMGGQTQAMFPGLAAAVPHIRSGRMRPLAVTGKQRTRSSRTCPPWTSQVSRALTPAVVRRGGAGRHARG
jgi:tripartite-type tricarboxylate transporter receptor subunit TctC